MACGSAPHEAAGMLIADITEGKERERVHRMKAMAKCNLHRAPLCSGFSRT
jgi:hypothetical protein